MNIGAKLSHPNNVTALLMDVFSWQNDKKSFDEFDGILVINALQDIPYQRRKAISLRYGLAGQEPMTISRVGKYIGIRRNKTVTRERASQVIHHGLRSIRMRIFNNRPEAVKESIDEWRKKDEAAKSETPPRTP